MVSLEIINQEIRKDNDNLFKLHLYLDGEWWRAYEWSAYLLWSFPNGLDEKERLKSTHKKVNKTEDGIIFNGIKLSSFAKYLPCIDIDDKSVLIEDGHMVIDVSKQYSDKDITLESYENIFKEWKSKTPYKETTNKQKSVINSDNVNELSVMAIMQKVLGYPIEDRTPLQNTNFISELKQELSKLI